LTAANMTDVQQYFFLTHCYLVSLRQLHRKEVKQAQLQKAKGNQRPQGLLLGQF